MKRAKAKTKTTYPASGAGLMVITRRDLKARLRRVFWKGAEMAHPNRPILTADLVRLAKAFEAHWKVEQ